MNFKKGSFEVIFLNIILKSYVEHAISILERKHKLNMLFLHYKKLKVAYSTCIFFRKLKLYVQHAILKCYSQKKYFKKYYFLMLDSFLFCPLKLFLIY